MQGRASDARLILLVLVLLGLVALASRPATSASGDLSAPAWIGVASDTIAQTLLIVLLVAAVVATAINVWAILPLPRGVPRSRPFSASITAYLYFAAAVCFLILLRQRLPRPPVAPTRSTGGGLGIGSVTAPLSDHAISWLSFLMAFIIILTAAGLLVRWWRSVGGSRAAGPPASAESFNRVAAAVENSLDELHAEADPRRAVIAAYAHLEADLKAVGRPRQPAEAPLEYLARILSDFGVGSAPLRRLTDLFEWAKFSQHTVAPSMKEDAIAALLQVRADLADAPVRLAR
jgi:uncharacterized protein DUF4129